VVSGDTIIVGAPSAGSAFVFVRNGTNGTPQATLKSGDAIPSFGWSVALSVDTAVVGAYGNSAYVFVRDGTNWTRQAQLASSNLDFDDAFGNSVSISGDLIVVGAPYEASNATGVNGNYSDNSAPYAGAAYVFLRNGSVWTQQAYLKA